MTKWMTTWPNMDVVVLGPGLDEEYTPVLVRKMVVVVDDWRRG